MIYRSKEWMGVKAAEVGLTHSELVDVFGKVFHGNYNELEKFLRLYKDHPREEVLNVIKVTKRLGGEG